MVYLYSIDLLNGRILIPLKGFITFLLVQTIDILRKHVSFYESLRQRECSRRTLFSVLNDIRTGVYADVVLRIRKRVETNNLIKHKRNDCRRCVFADSFGDVTTNTI